MLSFTVKILVRSYDTSNRYDEIYFFIVAELSPTKYVCHKRRKSSPTTFHEASAWQKSVLRLFWNRPTSSGDCLRRSRVIRQNALDVACTELGFVPIVWISHTNVMSGGFFCASRLDVCLLSNLSENKAAFSI